MSERESVSASFASAPKTKCCFARVVSSERHFSLWGDAPYPFMAAIPGLPVHEKALLKRGGSSQLNLGRCNPFVPLSGFHLDQRCRFFRIQHDSCVLFSPSKTDKFPLGDPFFLTKPNKEASTKTGPAYVGLVLPPDIEDSAWRLFGLSGDQILARWVNSQLAQFKLVANEVLEACWRAGRGGAPKKDKTAGGGWFQERGSCGLFSPIKGWR